MDLPSTHFPASILSVINDGVVVIAASSQEILYCNAAGRRLLHLPAQEASLPSWRSLSVRLGLPQLGQLSLDCPAECFIGGAGDKRAVCVSLEAHALPGGNAPEYHALILRDITPRRRNMQVLEERAEMARRLNQALSARAVADVLLDALDRLVGWDAAFVDLFASDLEQRLLPGRYLVPVVHYDLIDGSRREVAPATFTLSPESATSRALAEGPLLIQRVPEERLTGAIHFGNLSRPSESRIYVPIMGHHQPMAVLSIQSYAAGHYTAESLALVDEFAAVCSSAFERIRALERVKLLEAAVLHSSDMMLITATDPMSETGTSIIFANHAFEQFTGYQLEEIRGKSARILHGPLTDANLHAQMIAQLSGMQPFTMEIVNYRKDGSPYVAEITTYPIAPSHSLLSFYVSVHRDVTARKNMEESLRYRAYHDHLTGLANRTLLMDRLQVLLNRPLGTRRLMAIIFFDLDDFKGVNDCYGHATGDELLRQVARRLERCVRPGDTIARFGGDEFVVLLDPVGGRDGAEIVAKRIIQVFADPIPINGVPHHSSMSMGVVVAHPTFDEDARTLLLIADEAMYRAKGAGKNRMVLEVLE